MNQVFLHLFPLSVFALLIGAGIAVVYYFNTIRRIQQHLEKEHPEVWEDLGKPNIFSDKSGEKAVNFQLFINSGKGITVSDRELADYIDQANRRRKSTSILLFVSIIQFILTIIVVRHLTS